MIRGRCFELNEELRTFRLNCQQLEAIISGSEKKCGRIMRTLDAVVAAREMFPAAFVLF